LSDKFDGKVLNPFGVEIDLPFWVFKRLKKLSVSAGYRATGKYHASGAGLGLPSPASLHG
jgi:hypothetical protein